MSFKLARLKGRSVPRVRELPVAAGSAFELGALLVLDANGEFAECPQPPTAVGAVAEAGFGPNTSGFGAIGGRREFPEGYALGTTVADEVSFRAEFVGALPAAVGGSYGVVRDADGRWKVNFADTAAPIVKLVSLLNAGDLLGGSDVEVVFLPSIVQVI